MHPDVIGWIASAILLATLIRQIAKSAHSDDAGVSRWLFIGQCLASLGFVVYSALVGNAVFVATNAAILLTAVVGQVLRWRRKRRG